MANKGVKAQFSKDNKTVTTWAYPGKSGYAYKLTQKTWKNECTLCIPVSHKKKAGKLAFNPKGTAEGELTCKQCGADFDCVSGKDKAYKVRGSLKPATTTANSTSKVASSKTQSQKCSLSKAQALTKAKKLLKTKPDFKASMKIPIIDNINISDRVEINLKGFEDSKNKQLYISEIKEDIDNQTYDLTLIEGYNKYTVPYEGEYIFKDKKGNIIKSSTKNPYNAKCETVNVNIGLKDNSEIGKKIKLKGQELGTVKKIYKWLRIKSGGGTGGWTYKKYIDHIVKSEDAKKFGSKSAEKCWKTKKANCVDFSWIMAKMGEGAGKKIGIKRGDYTSLDGKKRGHMWNTYNGKNYDCSSSTDKTITLAKVEKVQ